MAEGNLKRKEAGHYSAKATLAIEASSLGLQSYLDQHISDRVIQLDVVRVFRRAITVFDATIGRRSDEYS